MSFILLFSLCIPLHGEVSPGVKKDNLNYMDCIILGVVEGITEYLPISSTGHLLITNEFLGLNQETPVGFYLSKPNIDLKPKTDNEKSFPIESPYTLKEAAFAYVIIIQAGAILAVIFLYRVTILHIFLGLVGKKPKGLKLGLLILMSFLPAAILGLALNNWIENQLGDHLIAIAIALFLGAILMLYTDSKRKKMNSESQISFKSSDAKNNADRAINELDQLNYKQALFIGFAQCLALWPGMSRSMVTIVGGYWIGLSPKKAAEYSFLLGLITLSAASAYTLTTDGALLIKNMPIAPMIAGCIVAFISATYAIRFLVSCLNRYGLAPFAWYRIALALFLALFFLAKS